MSIRDQVHKLERELAFWREVHKHEPPDETEFRLERQIRDLANPDEFGINRYDGCLDDDEDEEPYDDLLPPRRVRCRYCGESGLRWRKVDGKFRLASGTGLHTCADYYNQSKRVRDPQ